MLRLSPPQPQCADQWHLECTGAELYSVLSQKPSNEGLVAEHAGHAADTSAGHKGVLVRRPITTGRLWAPIQNQSRIRMEH